MKKTLLTSLLSLLFWSVSQAYIYGPSSICSGFSGAYIDSSLVSGGTWSCLPATMGTITTAGVFTPSGTGAVQILYSDGLATDTLSIMVFETPAPITAPTTSICAGTHITMVDATPGGTWYSYNPGVAQAEPGGIIYGWYPGVTTIEYTTGGSCVASITVTVNGVPTVPITVPATVCLGSSAIAVDSVSGGVWSSSDTTVATIAGISPYSATVNGISPGTATLFYTVTGSCGPATVSATINVSNTTDPGTLSGDSTMFVGDILYLYPSVTGGVWATSSSSVATVDADGNIYGVSPGAATVQYTVSGCGGAATITAPLTVTPFDGISGDINFSGTPYFGWVKVWLITYASSVLTAVDSAFVYSNGTSAHYDFWSEPTNDYRIKAAAIDSVGTSVGYIPTYHTSSFYWSTADVLSHTAGTGDCWQNINMITGIPTSGPGFIGGDVTTGANKGTTTGMPVDGMMMYLLDASNTLYQSTRTDAAGHYSFSNIPAGTYYVFPDSLNYATTPYTGIVITSGSPTWSAASFIQHTFSKTITPIPVSVSNVSTANASVVVFPNPSSGKVNIAWQVASAQKAEVTVTDITGRVVLSNTLDMSTGAGSSVADMSALISGLYTISVKSAELNYNTKIQVQH